MADPVTPEIPASYQRADALISELLADPELGGKVRARAKERFPDAGFSFVEDRIDPVAARLEAQLAEERTARLALEESVAADRTAREEATRADEFRGRLASAKDKFRLNDHGFEMAVQRMRDTNSYDAEAAAAWAAAQNPVVKDPKAYLGPQSADFFGSQEASEDWALLHKNPEKFVDAEMRAFFADEDKYTRDAGYAA